MPAAVAARRTPASGGNSGNGTASGEILLSGPGLAVPGLAAPGLAVPGLPGSGLAVPGLEAPGCGFQAPARSGAGSAIGEAALVMGCFPRFLGVPDGCYFGGAGGGTAWSV